MNRALLTTALCTAFATMIAGCTTTSPPDTGAPAAVPTPQPLGPPTACPAGSVFVNNACTSAPPTTPTPVTPTTPVSGGPVTTPVPVGSLCDFDTHAVLVFQGRVIESITSRGRLFNFEENGTPWPSNGLDLFSVPYFAAGPCAGQAPGHCTLDTRSFALFGDTLIEFVTANGRSWAFDNGVPTDAGTDLATVPRYAEACALRGGGPCRFSTRAFVNLDGNLLETITAYGKYFAFDSAGHRAPDNGVDLTQVPRYATGPCLGAPPGQCKLDTRTYGLAGGQTVEIVTARGMVWRWLAGGTTQFSEIQPSGVPMTNVASWATGPCR